MSGIDTPAATRPFFVDANEGEPLWFLDTLVTIKARSEDTGGGLALVEQRAPRGMGSPLHVHRNEDEWFYVLDGELTIWVGGETVVAGAGAFAYGPRDVPHTFVVTADDTRFLLGAQPAGFEDFVRAVGEPASRRELPPSDAPVPERDLVALAARHGIEILGPPGIPS